MHIDGERARYKYVVIDHSLWLMLSEGKWEALKPDLKSVTLVWWS